MNRQPLFLSLLNLAKRYDFNPNYLRSKLSKFELIEGVHYITICGTKRYDPDKIIMLLVQPKKVVTKVENILNNFKI